MRPPGFRTIGSAARVLWAAVRSPREQLTLDRLRSDLSHETAAKFARLSSLAREWAAGRFQASDAPDAEAILRDLDRIWLRHSRLASGRLDTFGRLAGWLAGLASLRAALAPLRRHGTLPRSVAERLAQAVESLRTRAQLFVDLLSGRHAARLGALLAEATEEIRQEAARGEAEGTLVVLESPAEPPATWVPRRDAAAWSDVLRNLIRNAVQATEERPGRTAQTAVTVRSRRLPDTPGAVVEILDEGVGMGPEEIAAMWRAGRSRHGAQRGQGLTESKRTFVEQRATLEVRSAPGVGTCVRIEIPGRDIPIRAPHLWALPALAVPVAAIVAAAALASGFLLQPDVVTVEVKDATVVRARDARGALVWQRDMHETVLPNYLGMASMDDSKVAEVSRHLVLGGRRPGDRGVILATQPLQGPGRIWRLDTRGDARWVRTLGWLPPRTAYTGNLKCVFETLVPWNGTGQDALALNVRRADWSATTIQFFSLAGDSLGAYFHPGQLEYFGAEDCDGDGDAELILTGVNNAAMNDRAFLPENPGAYPDCLILLEPPRVNGQAYPYRSWGAMPAAAEDAYLLLSPLRHGVRPFIEHLTFTAHPGPGRPQVQLQLHDGRIYELDSHLRPLACGVGDFTLADSLAPTRPLAPLLYIREGKRETIDLPVLREGG